MAIPSASTSTVKAGGVPPQASKSTAPSGLGGSVAPASALNAKTSTVAPSKGTAAPDHAGQGGETDPQVGEF
jgi:hypothetical protein